MFKYDIAYTDYNGNSQTKELYFNISKAEMLQLQFSEKEGMDKKLQKIVDSNDPSLIMKTFMDIVDLAYGVKSEDGNRFIKSPEILKEFKETEAYSEFISKLLTEEGLSERFTNGIIPDVNNRQTLAGASKN